jgi:hypothetical protein
MEVAPVVFTAGQCVGQPGSFATLPFGLFATLPASNGTFASSTTPLAACSACRAARDCYASAGEDGMWNCVYCNTWSVGVTAAPPPPAVEYRTPALVDTPAPPHLVLLLDDVLCCKTYAAALHACAAAVLEQPPDTVVSLVTFGCAVHVYHLDAVTAYPCATSFWSVM